MNLYVDLATRRIVFSPKLNKEIARVDVKRGDVFPLSIVFIRNGKPVQINATPQIEFCAKSKNNLEGLALVYANSFTLTNGSTNPSYNGTVAFNSTGLATILNNVEAEEDDLQFIDLYSEISWIDGTQVYTTSNLVLRVYNDVIKGNEFTPTPQPNEPVIFLHGIETPTIEGIDGGSVTVNGTLNANHIHGNIAGTLYTHVRTGEAMNKGDPFYISGFHVGTSQPIVMRADASNAAKMPAVGVMDADYANHTSGANGIISGTLSSINTNGYAVNSPIYVKNGGGYSNVAGTIRQQVGITERANTNTGAFIVTNSKVISSADITDFTTAVEAIAPNAVTSATTSDGTASLDISNLTLSQAITSGLQTKMVFTAEPTAVGDGQQIIWQWYNGGSPITTAAISSEATASTSDKLIFKTTEGGSLTTSLDLTNTLATFSGSISSLGESYRTSSTFAYASGAAAAHRTALGLTTLATTTAGTNVANFLETPTSANLASALTDENGTGGGFVRAEGATLTSPSIAGTASFTGTTRPTSAGTGTPAATSLITSNDAYYKNIVNPLKQGEIPIIPLSQFYAESASAGYMLNTSLQSTLSVYADPSTAQNSWYRYVLSASIFNQVNYVWSYTRGSELFFLVSNNVTSKAGTRHQIAITNTAPEGTIDTASRFGLAIEVFFVSGVLNARLLRKLTAASSLETSSSVAFSGTFGALWLRTNADGSIELRVLSSSNFTTLPLRPESASVTLPSGTYTNAVGNLYMTGLATSATIVDNGCYFQVYKAQYHIDS